MLQEYLYSLVVYNKSNKFYCVSIIKRQEIESTNLKHYLVEISSFNKIKSLRRLKLGAY